ncbi:hypothetical protein NL676_037665 [Syzygium grande]|nr:hypothetical protein NL676_037665 [Syzygium grande]
MFGIYMDIQDGLNGDPLIERDVMALAVGKSYLSLLTVLPPLPPLRPCRIECRQFKSPSSCGRPSYVGITIVQNLHQPSIPPPSTFRPYNLKQSPAWSPPLPSWATPRLRPRE